MYKTEQESVVDAVIATEEISAYLEMETETAGEANQDDITVADTITTINKGNFVLKWSRNLCLIL